MRRGGPHKICRKLEFIRIPRPYIMLAVRFGAPDASLLVRPELHATNRDPTRFARIHDWHRRPLCPPGSPHGRPGVRSWSDG